jgi:hypothetical protein
MDQIILTILMSGNYKIIDEELEDLNMTTKIFHGKWNYCISLNQDCLTGNGDRLII